MPNSHNVTNVFFFLVAAFALVAAFDTERQELASGQPVRFGGIFTSAGMPTGSSDYVEVFTCPATAFYFVHYRLLMSTAVGSPPCSMELTITRGGLTFVFGVSSFTPAIQSVFPHNCRYYYAAGKQCCTVS